MLSSVGRAAVRRLVSMPVTTAPRRIAVSWPLTHTIKYSRGFIQGFATAGRPKGTATKKTATTSKDTDSTKTTKSTKASAKETSARGKSKKATTTKAKATTSAASGTGARGAKKKALSPSKKAVLEKKELKKTALYGEPKHLPERPWTVYIYEQTKDKNVQPPELRTIMKGISEAFKAMSASERQRLESICDQNKAKNEAAYTSWVETYTPSQIQAANRARQTLKKKYGFPPKANLKLIRDKRIPKRPSNPYSLFTKARWASGDFTGHRFGEAAREISREWLRMSDVERHAYEDLGKAAREDYEKMYEAVMDHKPAARRTRRARNAVPSE
ncbi:hypothetical protein F5Y11DRAFT_235800 [Daldinia sp. FL1419]|nr:hypothetical protein F5Y11DRAFT_235800 [Daldinia sp. FL1419]